jgi:O-antigen/teichoic acid export membrane protein
VVAGRALNLVLALIPSVLLVRYLGADGLGQYAAIYAYLALFVWLPTFGMDQIVVRQAAQAPDDAPRIIGTGILLSLAFSFAALALAAGSAAFSGYAGEMWLLLALAGVDVLLLSCARLPAVVFQLKLRQQRGVVISTTRQVLWAACVAVLVALELELAAIVIARFLCGVVEAVLTFWDARRVLRFHLGWDSGVAKRVLSHAWPMALATLGVGLQQRIDQVLIHTWLGSLHLGHYVAAVNITELFAVVPAAVMSTMLPILSGVAAHEDRFQRYTVNCFRYLGSAAFGICIVLTLSAAWVVRLLYGAEYLPARPILMVLCWSLLAIFLGGALTVVLVAEGKQKFLPISTAVAAALNLALNVVLIPRAGGVGAAWATVISYSISAVGVYLLIPETRWVAWTGMRACGAPALAAAATVCVALLLPPVAGLLLAPLAYLAALRVLGVWDASDVAALTGAVGYPRARTTA